LSLRGRAPAARSIRLDARPIVTIERAASHRHGTKRALDIIAGSIALLVLLPLMVVIAITVWAADRGPIFFLQTRVGLRGEPFRILKFRSMTIDAESRRADLVPRNEADGPLFKLRNDPRVTPVGRFLRRHSLDELPQLINVLAGTMSLVGPRPALPSEVAHYDAVTHRRLDVKPGITGEWQVRGRTELSWHEGVTLDLDYARNFSLRRDLSILARTARVVALSVGGY
jgi:lipopolysaccharide/colanic/teichoic acid biosynthesis glycosyltransferase